MNYEDQVLALFGEANPVSDLDTLEDLMSPRLEVIEQRTGDMPDTKVREIDPSRPIFKKDRRFGLVYGLAAALVVLMIGSVVWAVFLNDSEPDVARQPAQTPTTTPVTTQPPPTATAAVFTVDEALSVKDAYIEASNAGDVDAVLALFEPDSSVVVGTLTVDLVTFERYLVWSIAEGTTVTASDCTANELEDGVELTCGSTRHQHLAVAVGAPAAEGTLTLRVTADGIRNFVEDNNPSDFNVVNVPFDRWLEENHSEDFDTRIRAGAWDSVAEAEQAGTLRGRYADEWAAYLDANGCTYQNPDC